MRYAMAEPQLDDQVAGVHEFMMNTSKMNRSNRWKKIWMAKKTFEITTYDAIIPS